MNRVAAGLVLGLALLVAGGGIFWWWRTLHPGRGTAQRPAEAVVSNQPAEHRGFDLYFPAGEDGLAAESRDLAVTDSPKDRIRRIVEALLEGPRRPGLGHPYPPEVKLGTVMLSADGIAYLDLRWGDHPDPPASGSTAEIQRIYSLVDSVAFNVPQATRVVLLWNGVQRVTFAGHVDTSRPLLPDRDLLVPAVP